MQRRRFEVHPIPLVPRVEALAASGIEQRNRGLILQNNVSIKQYSVCIYIYIYIYYIYIYIYIYTPLHV